MIPCRAEGPPILQTKPQYRNSDYLSRQGRLMISMISPRGVLLEAKTNRCSRLRLIASPRHPKPGIGTACLPYFVDAVSVGVTSLPAGA